MEKLYMVDFCNLLKGVKKKKSSLIMLSLVDIGLMWTIQNKYLSLLAIQTTKNVIPKKSVK